MLNNYIFLLSSLLNSSYSDLNYFTDKVSFLDPSIQEEIKSKLLFQYLWNTKTNLNTSDKTFIFNYNIAEQNSYSLKINLSITETFLIHNYLHPLKCSALHNYVLICLYKHNMLKIIHLANDESNTSIFNKLSNEPLDNLLNSNLTNKNWYTFWRNSLNNLSTLYNKFNALYLNSSQNNILRNNTNFNVDNACKYAEKYALNPNTEYLNFENSGGDCTNFASQILHAGGLKFSSVWKPYTTAWLRVTELYSYIINSNYAYAVTDLKSLDRGSLIQFLSPKLNRYSHTGFITHKLLNNDYLYCCHTYNKLNYPLSYIFPVIYKTIRSANFY